MDGLKFMTPRVGLQRPTGGQSVSSVLSKFVPAPSRLWLWIYLVLGSSLTGAAAELCVYRRSVYNIFTSSYDKMLTTTSCPWGCCYKHNSPCCPAPVSLIVGCVLGGVLLVAIVIVAVCCCCICRHRRSRAARRGGVPVSNATSAVASSSSTAYPGERGDAEQFPTSSAPNPAHVVFRSDASQAIEFPMPPMYDQPPSYEEVMRGETNTAFKPDTS